MKKTFYDKLRDTPHVLFQGAGTFVPLSAEGLKDSSLQKIFNMQSNGDLATLVNGFFKFAIAVGAIAAVLRIAYAGYLYIGSDFWGNKGKAKEILTDVVIGLLLLLSIWIILKQINPKILELRALNTLQQNADTIRSQQQFGASQGTLGPTGF